MPAARALGPLRLSSQAAKTRPDDGSTATVSKRWLVVSAVIGRGGVKLAPLSREREKKARPLKFLSWKIAKVTISPPLGSAAIRTRASGPQSRFIGSGVTVTGSENVLPRSVDFSTVMRSAVARASHKVPSGPKAGVAVKASGAAPGLPC